MRDCARRKWRSPPNTISAAAIRPRAVALKPSTPSSPTPTMDSQREGEAGSGMTGSARPMRILILGGTIEARALAEALGPRADFAVTMSLAGRTAEPLPQAAPVRRGGFGGAEGLARYLGEEKIDVLIDATHPYAAAISANAARGAASAGVKLIALRQPPWRKVAGDDWSAVENREGAVEEAGRAAKRVFLTLGRNEFQPFAAAPQHFYLIRSVDPVDPPLAVP